MNMKKLFFTLLIGLIAVSAFAAMDSRDFSASTITTNAASSTFVLRGELSGIYATIPTGKTCTVAVATSEGTVFSKSLTASGAFFPRVACHDIAGAVTNSIAGFAPLAGPVTATFTPAAATTGTNAYAVKVIYNR